MLTFILLLLIGIGSGFLLHLMVMSTLKVYVKQKDRSMLSPLVDRWGTVLFFLFPIFVTYLILLIYPTGTGIENSSQFKKIGLILIIINISWFAIRCVNAIEDILSIRYRIDMEDNLQARKIRTQVALLEKVLIVTILIVGLAGILMTFESIRHLGTSLLASAGVIGIILGFAAQKTISTLFAGIQIAITQPIRIDDVVIVENEWGWIEEITLTYVVVKIWDLRRLVVPINYFIEKPFQNWTRVSADLLGSVFLHVDYQLPVEEVRQELKRVLEDHPLWDGKCCVLQVTDSKEHVMELRALMSAPTSPKAWDLRCDVREKLITFIQKNYPDSLPRLRAEISNESKESKEERS